MRGKKVQRQMQTAQWLGELEQYARERKLPMRILDELEACKKIALSDQADWDTVSRTIEELMESMEVKMAPAKVQNDNAKEEVSVEEVRIQVREMAQRCHTENVTSIDSMAERKNTVIRKMYGQLSEIGHTNAHLEELKREDLYLQFIGKCRISFERDVMEMIRELLQSISSNYGHMLDHMRSMFQSIGGYRNGIGNEKFYMEYEARKNGIDQSILGEAQTADMGGDDLTSFGLRTKDAIKGIVRKLVRKRKLLAWVPLVVLLCLVTVTAVARQEQSREVLENATQIEQNEDSSFWDFVWDWVGEAAKSKGGLQLIANFFLAMVISLGAMLIFVVLVIILLYLSYLKILKMWCHHQICKRCGEYLHTQLSQFEQNNDFAIKLDTVMKNAADEYERQYMEMLNRIFTNTGYEDESVQQVENTRWDVLREQWNQLKYR